MGKSENWRVKADRMLSVPVQRGRSIKSTVGKVEDRFEGIYSARQRGMSWKAIAAALEDDKPIKPDAVESAFKRLCAEKGVKRPSCRKSAAVPPSNVATSEPTHTPSITPPDLFNERWVDDGE